jgi:hypothetical protein
VALAGLPASGDPASQAAADAEEIRGWPIVTAETKPWTRWWWHGSAVDRGSLSAQLEVLRDAGLGGVEITPIYGVRGEEAQFIQYLSQDWMRMLEHTLREAERFGLGVDMATGTGWPFGGPWVGDEIASRSMVIETWIVNGGSRLGKPVRLQQTPLVRALGNQIHVVNEGAPGDPPRSGAGEPVLRQGARAIQITDLVEPVPANRNLQALALEQVKYPRDLPLAALVAYGDDGSVIDLTRRVSADRVLNWTAPPGTWTLYGVFAGWHGKLVERAAPGGEGNVIDHFSRDAIRNYLARFDRAFGDRGPGGLRAFFNDSYEVDDATGQADWTPALLDEFRSRHGYDLLRHLPALLGRDTSERGARVLADYRETISDLLLDRFTVEWTGWARARGRLTRNQAHGSPASLLDLYGASDIPETEGAEIQRFKWATSAAHVAGRRLVSAEAATWLGEHFRSTLGDVRTAIDRFFVAGVNHIVYHGTAYSPEREPWPGRLFYAAVAFSPQNAWWDDFRALNEYVTRVQSFLQHAGPDHDVLLYYPLYEVLAVHGNARLAHFGGANPQPSNTAFEAAAETMQRQGFTYDFISDRQLLETRVENGALVTPGGSKYRVVVIPGARYIPVQTFEQSLALARAGATVVSFRGWPADVSGLADLEANRDRLTRAIGSVRFGPAGDTGIREAPFGRGTIVQGDVLAALLERTGIRRERLVDQGLHFARRIDRHGRLYFISNPADREIDGWVELATDATAVTMFDPLHGRAGDARTRRPAGGSGTEVHLQIPPGGSMIVATSRGAMRNEYPAYRRAVPVQSLDGPWMVRFDKGGPSLPAARTIDRLTSWTAFGGEDVRAFSGTATYTITVPSTQGRADAWELDLGEVRDSARVRVDGRPAGTVFSRPYRLVLADLRPGSVLEITVTNLSANRIADLDRRGGGWKKFYNVNFPARLPENRGPDGLFTAAGWPPLDSGLIGPVSVTPLTIMR